jgi:hypothetical protein
MGIVRIIMVMEIIVWRGISKIIYAKLVNTPSLCLGRGIANLTGAAVKGSK